MAYQHDIDNHLAGDTLVIDCTVDKADGSLLDLTGASLRWGVAHQTDARPNTPYLTKTIGDGIAVTDALGGKVTITAAVGEITKPGQDRHELEVVTAAGESFTVFWGFIKIRAAIFAD